MICGLSCRELKGMDGCLQEGSLYSLSRFVRAGTEVETRAGRLVPFCHLSARSWCFPSGQASSATTCIGPASYYLPIAANCTRRDAVFQLFDQEANSGSTIPRTTVQRGKKYVVLTRVLLADAHHSRCKHVMVIGGI